MTATSLHPAAIDPWRSCPRGVYDDGVVRVRAGADVALRVWRDDDGRVVVDHDLRPAQLDDEIGEPLAAALARHTDDHDVFTRVFAGVVLTARPRAEQAWELFYRNSLARIRHPRHLGYAAVHRHALDLLPASTVLDLGASFGFLSLHLASTGRRVTAWEPDPGTAELLRGTSARLRVPVDVLAPDRSLRTVSTASVEGVALLHVLEHVGHSEGLALFDEAVRIARRRLVVAVPYEPVGNPLFGHVRTFTRADLLELGLRGGRPFEVHDEHGGWLVIDTY